MAKKRRRIRPITVMYAGLAVIFVFAVGNLVVDQVRGPNTSPAPPLTAAGKPYARAVLPKLQGRGPIWAGYTGLSPEEARCVAAKWVMILGPDRLAAAGIAPVDFGHDPAGASDAVDITWEEAQRIRRDYERCGIPAKALIARAEIAAAQGTGARRNLAPLLGCVADRLDEHAADRMFVLSLTQPSLGQPTGPSFGGYTPPRITDLDTDRDVENATAACEAYGG